MAEILLSLTIIGVVAAITLPSLTGNINERTWNTQRKALYARFSQAIALMPSLNGYGTLSATEDTAAETFVTEGLAKVLKINNICDSEHLADCGIPSTITPLDGGASGGQMTLANMKTLTAFNSIMGSVSGHTVTGGGTSSVPYNYSQMDTKAAAFETVNGESILVYYNPNCRPYTGSGTGYDVLIADQPHMCANFVYDLNGNKGPNTVGKDIGFISALYPSDPVVVAPVPALRSAGAASQRDAGKLCKAQDSESRVPNIEEVSAILYNKPLVGIQPSTIWSSTLVSDSKGSLQAWSMSFHSARRCPYDVNREGIQVWCVKR